MVEANHEIVGEQGKVDASEVLGLMAGREGKGNWLDGRAGQRVILSICRQHAFASIEMNSK